MDTADGARNCTTAFPQDSLTSMCSMAAARRLPRVLYAQGWGSNAIYLYWFYWGGFSVESAVFSLRARRGDVTAGVWCHPLAPEVLSSLPALKHSREAQWQAHLENHSSRYCPSCLQNLRSWFLWYEAELKAMALRMVLKSNPFGRACPRTAWDPSAPGLCPCFSTSLQHYFPKGLLLTTHPHYGNLTGQTTEYLGTVVLERAHTVPLGFFCPSPKTQLSPLLRMYDLWPTVTPC